MTNPKMKGEQMQEHHRQEIADRLCDWESNSLDYLPCEEDRAMASMLNDMVDVQPRSEIIQVADRIAEITGFDAANYADIRERAINDQR